MKSTSITSSLSSKKLAPVSVVIPCYRCANTIARALESVFAQTWRPAELILIDDHSDDETLAQLHMLKCIYPADWIHILVLPENSGPGTARNTGWKHSSQPYIAFLDADDAWHPKKVEIQLSWMLEHPDVALTGHASQFITEEMPKTDINLLVFNDDFSQISKLQLLLSNRFPTRSVILKRSLPYRFHNGKRYSEDYLLWCEICLNGHMSLKSTLPLAYHFKSDFGDAGLSGNLWSMQKGQIDTYTRLRTSRLIGLASLMLLFSWSLLRFVRRFCVVCFRSLVLRC